MNTVTLFVFVFEFYMGAIFCFFFQAVQCDLLILLELDTNWTSLLFTSHKALGHSSSNFRQIQSLRFVNINNDITYSKKEAQKWRL